MALHQVKEAIDAVGRVLAPKLDKEARAAVHRSHKLDLRAPCASETALARPVRAR
jgi:hypothetical protein